MDDQILPPPSPPLAPPLPPSRTEPKASSFALKVRSAPQGWAFQGKVVSPVRDPLTPPAGVYFLYGTLKDSVLLAKLLHLTSPPVLRPAFIVGYETKLWGPYPALVDGEGGAIVEGSAFDVLDEVAAAKLAYYETQNYRVAPCNIEYKDGTDPELRNGYTFMFCGNQNDLEDGAFDLSVWLKRMGRKAVD